MTTSTSVRSWGAIAIGVFFTAVTAWVLLEDVWHGAPVTSKHIMTAAVLCGTIAFGHMMWRELRAFRVFNAFGCVVLFMMGTATCVVMSAGRNAEVSITKASDANKVNGDRDRMHRNLIEAKASYKDAVDGNDPAHKEVKTRYASALEAEGAECGSGAGPKCMAKRALTEKLKSDVVASDTNRRILVELRRGDVEKAEADLRTAPSEKIANADIKAAAGLLSKLPYVTADAITMEALLLLFFPFMQALFCEVGAIVGYSIGFGHVVRQLPAAPSLPQLPPPSPVFSMQSSVVSTPVSEFPTPSKAYVQAKKSKPTDAQMVLDALERAGRPLSNDELAVQQGVSKGESSKRLRNCGDTVVIARVGKCYAVSPNYQMV